MRCKHDTRARGVPETMCILIYAALLWSSLSNSVSVVKSLQLLRCPFSCRPALDVSRRVRGLSLLAGCSSAYYTLIIGNAAAVRKAVWLCDGTVLRQVGEVVGVVVRWDSVKAGW